MDATKRSCTVIAVCGIEKVHLIMSFPSAYPYNSPPTFLFGRKTTVDKPAKTKLLKALKATSQHQVKRNRSCLEPCLRQLVSTLESFNFEDKDLIPTESSYMRMDTTIPTQYISPPVYGSFQDSSVPFPRTSGARFCGADFLICFVRPPHLQKINAPTEVTPRSLSALGAYLSTHLLPIQSRQQSTQSQFTMYPPVAHSPTGDPSVSISSFYFHDRKQKLRGRIHKLNVLDKKAIAQKPPSISGAVVIYSIEGVIPISRTLAENYVYPSYCEQDFPSMCSKNASAAAAVGRKDLVQIWNIAALMSSQSLLHNIDPDKGYPWSQHPFGRKMLESILNHYIHHLDIQTVAMLCCTFGCKTDEVQRNRKLTTETGSSSPGGSPYHTVVPADTQYAGWNLVVGTLKRNRSNSWSDSGEEFRITDYFQDPKEAEKDEDESNFKMLDPKKTQFYDQFKKVYAEILYRWNLFEQRAQVLKYVSTTLERHKGIGKIEFLNECPHCAHEIRGAQCASCKNYSLNCSVCHTAVKGASNFCLCCGHGGHTTHMFEWFESMDMCPTGCGCNCLETSNSVFGP